MASDSSWKRIILLAVIGLIYGLLLAGFGLGIANGGDGPMVPLYVFGSPFFYPFVFFAPVALWMFIGMLLGSVGERGYRVMFFALMALHYLGIVPYVLLLGDGGRTYELMRRALGMIAFVFSIYAVGQVAIWGYYLERRQAADPAADA